MQITLNIAAIFGICLLGMALVDWLLYTFRGAGFIKIPETIRFIESIMILMFSGILAVFILKNLKNFF